MPVASPSGRDASNLWLLPGLASLAAFGWLLAQVDTDLAGRAYTAYDSIYLAAYDPYRRPKGLRRPDATVGSCNGPCDGNQRQCECPTCSLAVPCP
ncbi:hypothetical protein ATO8_08746 [Roseivivax marinus]|uniref:Uncharacterized protein n=1 Tax=Roseivivax marinus TaxID=1379903 RepID=W4HKM0_9RHOB|nr:hypothetical protein ATO8_08746 [Roseivivax marinus]